jgi:hypothetical protein
MGSAELPEAAGHPGPGLCEVDRQMVLARIAEAHSVLARPGTVNGTDTAGGRGMNHPDVPRKSTEHVELSTRSSQP